ncbi:nitrous oxide reductase accessory protein NosL [Oceanobacillus sp. CAU 1775]
MRKLFLSILLIGLIGILAACGGTSHEPVDISIDTDQCYTCHMGIEDLDSATQVILEDGTPRVFDDIGCMLVYFQETDDEIAVSYVVDRGSGEWIDMADAYFVHDETIQTPMSYGFIAFDSEEAATAHGSGEVISTDALKDINVSELEDWYRGHSDGHH